MTEGPAGRRASRSTTWVFALATTVFTVAAALVLFSAFMFYDDEGYVLVSLRNFADYGGLYRDVYTQYGPFPFVAYWALHLVGLPITHLTGRLITLGFWVGTAVATASLAGFVTRSLLVRLWVLAGTFVYLWVMSNEPSHPGGLIVFLTVLVAVLGHRWIAGEKIGRWAVGVGAVTAVLVLTKINIGVFLAYSACCWWILHCTHHPTRRLALPLTIAWSVALPVALMRSLQTAPWVQTFIWVFACSAVALMIVSARHARDLAGWGELWSGLAAAVAVGGAVLGLAWMRGSSASDLIEGLVLGPLRHPAAFSLRYPWPAGTAVIVGVSFVGCIAAVAFRRRHEIVVNRSIALARLFVAGALAFGLARYPVIRPDYFAFGFVLPCLWLMVWPLAVEKPALTGARTWVALVLLGQCLHAFPVSGSQIAWGSVLLIPLAAVGAWEAAAWLARDAGIAFLAARGVALAGRAAVVALLAVTTWQFANVAGRYREGQNLGLPGAELIRVPDSSATQLRVLAHNAGIHADMLFSLPGMFSFNLWTDVPTPSHANVTHWFSLLDARRQQAVIDALASHPRACVIIDRGHLAFLAERGIVPHGPLYDYIEQAFVPAFTIDRMEFCVRRGRAIQPVLVADLLTRQAGADTTAAESTLLRWQMFVPPAAPVARLQIDAVPAPFVLDARNARVEITPVNARGEPTAPSRQVTWPFTFDAPSLVSIYYDRAALARPRREATLILSDAGGREVGLARLRP